jgi:hypothetical protein
MSAPRNTGEMLTNLRRASEAERAWNERKERIADGCPGNARRTDADR